NQNLFPAGTTTGTGVPIAVNHCQQISGHFIWSTGITAGVAVVEIADSTTTPGTWFQIAKSDVVADSITGPADVGWTHPFPPRPGRGRILTPVAGGSIQMTVNGLTGA